MVMAIMALLMAIGAGVWIKFRRNSSGQEAYARLAAMTRRARVFALEESAGARLVLDVKGRSFHAEGLRLLGMWNLEGQTDPRRPGVEVGFAGREMLSAGGLYANGKEPVAGYRGGGVYLNGQASLVMADEAFVFPEGGELSCFVRPERDSAATNTRQTLFSRGVELQFFINVSGLLEVRSGSASFITGHRLPVGRWSHVAFLFRPEELVVTVDGVVRGRMQPGDLPAGKEQHLPLVLGANERGEFGLVGTVDEPAIRRLAVEPAYTLPSHLDLVSPVPAVCFDAAGMLDRRHHAAPVKMGIKRLDPDVAGGSVTRWVSVAMDGEIREE